MSLKKTMSKKYAQCHQGGGNGRCSLTCAMSHRTCMSVEFAMFSGLLNTKTLKCYSQILYGGSAKNFRFCLFCIDLVAN